MLDAKHKSTYIGGMNKLPLAKRCQMLAMLCEGTSMRAVARVDADAPKPGPRGPYKKRG